MKKNYLYHVQEHNPSTLPKELQDEVIVDEIILVTKLTNQKMDKSWYFSAYTIFMYNPRELDSQLETGPDDDWFLPVNDTIPGTDENYFKFTELGHMDNFPEYKL